MKTAMHDLYELGGHLCPNKAYKSCMAVLIHCIRAHMIPLLVLMYGSSNFTSARMGFPADGGILNHAVPGLVEGFIHGEHGE